MTTTRIDLDAIEALLAKATPGPLGHERRDHDDGSITRIAYGPRGDFASLNEVANKRARANIVALIAIVNAAPDLFAELRALREVERAAWICANALDHPGVTGHAAVAGYELRARLSKVPR